jgi:hypothetical protein
MTNRLNEPDLNLSTLTLQKYKPGAKEQRGMVIFPGELKSL